MSQQLKQHKMAYTTGVAHTAAADVTHFLQTHFVSPIWPQTVAVHNVEDEAAYQAHDVDLLWTVLEKEGRLRIIPIEIKGDRYHRTGNFFFETISNETRGTAGCFLYTKAEWLFYYFLEIGRLYCLPVTEVRPWFEQNSDRFQERRTSTPVRGEHYVTVGRLVPIEIALAEVSSILQFEKGEESWKRL